ncbi:MAG TPA: DUF3052 family protein [bacterium]|nr:DUF3052 family protein [bacterium]
MKMFILNPPGNYFSILGKLPDKIVIEKNNKRASDFIHFFSTQREELKSTFAGLKKALSQDGMLWISWPKRSSRLATDLNENVIRKIGLKNGLVDVKICSVNETWSGLKFVYRVKNRK